MLTPNLSRYSNCCSTRPCANVFFQWTYYLARLQFTTQSLINTIGTQNKTSITYILQENLTKTSYQQFKFSPACQAYFILLHILFFVYNLQQIFKLIFCHIIGYNYYLINLYILFVTSIVIPWWDHTHHLNTLQTYIYIYKQERITITSNVKTTKLRLRNKVQLYFEKFLILSSLILSSQSFFHVVNQTLEF